MRSINITTNDLIAMAYDMMVNEMKFQGSFKRIFYRAQIGRADLDIWCSTEKRKIAPVALKNLLDWLH